MKTPKINPIVLILILLCSTIFISGKKIEQSQIDPNYPGLDKRFSLFVKMDDAIIERENAGKRTWYTWKKALLNETIPGQAQGYKWCTLVTDDQTIMKMDSATWELDVNVTIIGDDGEKNNISYHSFEIPEVKTESKKYGWMTNASCEAGGKFYRNGYMFDMSFFEQPQNFRFRRIPASAF